VQEAQAVEADALVHLLQQSVELVTVGDVVARGVQVARVEAETEARMPSQAIDDRRQLVHRAPDRAAAAGGVLDQQPGFVRAGLERGLALLAMAFLIVLGPLLFATASRFAPSLLPFEWNITVARYAVRLVGASRPGSQGRA